MAGLRLTMSCVWIIIVVLLAQQTSKAEESAFLMSEEQSFFKGDVWLQPRNHQISKRQSPFDMPIVNALMWTIGILMFLLPLRLFRGNPAAMSASKRKDVTTAPIDVTDSPMTESAILAHRIVKAVEDGGEICANYTICSMADEVKKMGSRQEITISIAEKFLPGSLRPTIDVLRKAILFPKVDEFCQQFACAESQTNGNSVNANNNNNNSDDNYNDNVTNSDDTERDKEALVQINNEVESDTLIQKSDADKSTPFPMVEPADSEEEVAISPELNITEASQRNFIPEWRMVV